MTVAASDSLLSRWAALAELSAALEARMGR